MEAVLARVEWSTLLFFAALFILMEVMMGEPHSKESGLTVVLTFLLGPRRTGFDRLDWQADGEHHLVGEQGIPIGSGHSAHSLGVGNRLSLC